MIIKLLQQKVPVSTSICIILKTGQEVTGILTEIGEFYVVLRSDSGDAVLMEDTIGAWRMLTPPTVPQRVDGVGTLGSTVTVPGPTTRTASPLPPTSTDSERVVPRVAELSSSPWREASSPVSTPLYPEEVLRYEKNLLVRFHTATSKVVFEILPPNFVVSLEQALPGLSRSQRSELYQQWGRIKNQYDYAAKVREWSRLITPIAELEDIVKQHPEFTVGWYNLGCLAMRSGQAQEAIAAWESGAASAANADILQNLAVAYWDKRDYVGAYSTLLRLFQVVSPSRYVSSWYQFIVLVLQFGKMEALGELLRLAYKLGAEADVRLILDSTIYLLLTYDWVDDARTLSSLAFQQQSDATRVLDVFASICRRLQDARPDLLQREQQKKLQEASARQQQVAEVTRRQRDIQELLERGEQLARHGQYGPAQMAMDELMRLDPNNVLAKQRKQQYTAAARPLPPKKTLANSSSPAPTSRGYYERAKQAHLVQKDFIKAEELLRLAIQHQDNTDTAVKDLASLLQQQGRSIEAIELLEEYAPKATNLLPVQNLLAAIYQHSNQYEKAIYVLERILDISPQVNRAKVLKQIGYSQLKVQQFDRAELTLTEVLRLSPEDTTARKWLDGLENAKRTGGYSDLLESIIVPDILADFNPSLSRFLAFYLERCEYQGVAEARIASRSFSEDDLRKLRGLIEGAGKRRPRVRAQYSLSAGRLLMDLDTEDERRFRQYLHDYSADMANASMAEQKHFDVAFAFFAEAFAIAPQWNWKLRESLSQAIMIHYATREDILDDRLPAPEECLAQALRRPPVRVPLVESLLELSLVNPGVGQYLIPTLVRDTALCYAVEAQCCEIMGIALIRDTGKIGTLWDQGREHIRRQHQMIADELIYLQALASALDSVQTQIDKAKGLEQKLRRKLDRQRLNTIAEVLGHIYDYTQQQSYVERERLVTIVRRRIQELVAEIENSPTKFSVELYRPYLLELDKTMEQHFAKVQQAAEPEQLEYTLAVDSYVPDSESVIECQVTVTNPVGKSPASAFAIHVVVSPTDDYVVAQNNTPLRDALLGGESVTCTLPLTVTDKAKASQVFTLYYQMSYKTRTGRTIEMDNLALPVRLYPDAEFVKIENPYVYAEGGAVQREEMFYGREPVIQNLLSAIQNTPVNKSLIIYGQKRTGKSSIIYHLKQRILRQPSMPMVIPVDFSIGDIVDELSIVTLLYRIMQRLESAFDDLVEQSFPRINFVRPSLAQLNESPLLLFHDVMSDLQRQLNMMPEYRGAKILLLIDEFSYVYGEIVRGRIQDTFMKSWKALLEKGYFGSVLVGQDIMRQFIERFPNEFQVAQSQRVSYLAPDDALKLMVDPIRIPGTSESRYRGAALDRLLELTAGNPFYIQIFCSRLVEYMNRKKAIYLTDAHIERVKDELIGGTNHLTIANFDNLINAGDTGIDEIPDSETLKVLREIALATRLQDYCYQSTIGCATTVPLDVILEDLVRREVLEKHGPSLYRIRVELFKEWLLVHQ